MQEMFVTDTWNFDMGCMFSHWHHLTSNRCKASGGLPTIWTDLMSWQSLPQFVLKQMNRNVPSCLLTASTTHSPTYELLHVGLSEIMKLSRSQLFLWRISTGFLCTSAPKCYTTSAPLLTLSHCPAIAHSWKCSPSCKLLQGWAMEIALILANLRKAGSWHDSNSDSVSPFVEESCPWEPGKLDLKRFWGVLR